MQHPGTDSLARAWATIAALVLATALLLTAHAAPAGANALLVGDWTFDEGSGQFAQDSGPFGLHGVLGSSTEAAADDPLRSAGASGGALGFGSGAYVHVADRRRLDLQRLTVETVARAPSSPGSHRYLVAHGSRECFSGAYGLYTAANGGLAFYVFDGERYFVSASARPQDVWDGGWHRLTGTFDGRLVRAYVDGREVGAPFATPEGTSIESASMPEGTYFGSYGGSCQLPFSGELDSVRIWGDAVLPANVAANAGVAAGGSLTQADVARVIDAQPPKSSCKVQVSRRQIRALRRAQVTARVTAGGKPLSRVRLSVRRTNAPKVIAVRRTNVRGSAKIVLNVRRQGGRVRIGVVGRASCTPAFITISGR